MRRYHVREAYNWPTEYSTGPIDFIDREERGIYRRRSARPIVPVSEFRTPTLIGAPAGIAATKGSCLRQLLVVSSSFDGTCSRGRRPA